MLHSWPWQEQVPGRSENQGMVQREELEQVDVGWRQVEEITKR